MRTLARADRLRAAHALAVLVLAAMATMLPAAMALAQRVNP